MQSNNRQSLFIWLRQMRKLLTEKTSRCPVCYGWRCEHRRDGPNDQSRRIQAGPTV